MGRGRFAEGRDAHQPRDWKPISCAARVQECIGRLGQDPRLLWFGTCIDLNEKEGGVALLVDLLRQGRAQARPVHSVDRIKELHRLSGFIGLQRTNEMKFDIVVSRPERRPLGARFLHPILAKNPLTLPQDWLDRVGTECFGNSDQRHRGEIAL